jgi:glutaredoxin
MADGERPLGVDPPRRVRPRGAAGRGGHHDARHLPIAARVVVYHARDCHLCERALTQLDALQAELGFELERVDIGGVPELEARYRELIPAVEIDGRTRFTYYVQPDAFRRALKAV